MSRIQQQGPFLIRGTSAAVALSPSSVVDASFSRCRRITKQRASNFYYALRLTPEPKRSAMYAIYAALRACDDAVDGAPECNAINPDGDRQAALDHFHRQFEQVAAATSEHDLPAGNIWPALWCVMTYYCVDPNLFRSVIEGQRDDLRHARLVTFDDLYTYCYRVASTVGLLCISVWGHDAHPQVKQLAERRGVALQLTNILRDLREDVVAGRMYMPETELWQFGCRPEALRAGQVGPAFDRMMAFQIQRAFEWYEASRALEQHISADCRATSSAIAALYRRLLERIADEPRRVLYTRVRLSAMEKVRIASRAWWRHCGWRPAMRRS